jgi:hypothetical protein
MTFFLVKIKISHLSNDTRSAITTRIGDFGIKVKKFTTPVEIHNSYINSTAHNSLKTLLTRKQKLSSVSNTGF